MTPFELEWEMDSEEDEEETLEECRRIFNEAHSTSLAGGPTKEERPLVKTKRPTELEPAVPTKKRVAHNPELVKRPERPMGLAAHVSAAQAMHNRFAQLQQRYANQVRVATMAPFSVTLEQRNRLLDQLVVQAAEHITVQKQTERDKHCPSAVFPVELHCAERLVRTFLMRTCRFHALCMRRPCCISSSVPFCTCCYFSG